MLTSAMESLWLRQLSVHQDYGWFLVLLGWGFALVFWRWHPARREAWPWLPWVAGAGAFGAMVQFAIFSPPFDFFHSRLIPGTIANYRPALIEPQLLGDWLLALLFGAMVAGWGWHAASRQRRPAWRWIAVIAAALAVEVHVESPHWGGTLLALLALVAGAAQRPLPARPLERLALILAALTPALSTIGPLAAVLQALQRSGPPTPMGLLAATAQVVAAAVALAALAPGVLSRRHGLGWAQRWREARWAVLVALAWLLGGLLFAHVTGRDNRRELHQNRLRVVAARAALLDRELLQLLDEPPPPLHKIEWLAPDEPVAHVSEEAAQVGREISRVLLREHRATPFINGARWLVASEGWLVALASSRPSPAPGTIEVVRRLTPQDAADWAAARNLIEISPVAEIGQPYWCRAALRDPEGRMLGWLEFQQQEFFQSIERKWRAGPLLVTALGLILGATLLFQRRAEREREHALRAAAVESEASRVKSQFLATVSHELRTPLQSLLGYSELLRHRLGADPQARAWLGAVQQHGDLMTRLVNDLIDLGAIEAGTFRLAPRAADAAAITRAAVESLRHRAESKGLALGCAIEGVVPPAVHIDVERFRQVVLNLVGNAVKFTAAGRVDVRLALAPAAGEPSCGDARESPFASAAARPAARPVASPAHIASPAASPVPAAVDTPRGGSSDECCVLRTTGSALERGSSGELVRNTQQTVELVLEVKDTGPGIPAEAQRKLFVPFSRLEATAHHEGAGIGLALAAALCRAMHGGVRVESDGRSGSTFIATVAVPVSAEPVAAAPLAVSAETLAQRRVLIVDDNALIRDLFVAMLQQAGARCSVAATAESALATARHGDIEAVVLDLSLPGMSGLELALRLRELLPRARIVGASAHAAESERRAALAAGMHAFLAKPVTQAELVAALAGAVTSAAGARTGSAAPWRVQLEERFRAEAPEAERRVDAAIVAGDWARVRAEAHHLANSAAAVQDRALLAACEHVVRAAEAGDAAAVRARWPEAREALGRWMRED